MKTTGWLYLLLLPIIMGGTVIAATVGDGIEKFIPASESGYLIGFNPRQLFQCDGVKDFRRCYQAFDRDIELLEQELQRYQLDLETCFQYVTVYTGERFDLLATVETAVPESRFRQLIGEGFGRQVGVTFKAEQVGTRTVYTARLEYTNELSKDLPIGGLHDDVAGIVYLDPTHLLIARMKSLSAALLALQNKNLAADAGFFERKKRIAPHAFCWGVFRAPGRLKFPGNNKTIEDYLKNITGGDFSFSALPDGMNGVIRLHCRDNQAAQALTQQVQMMLVLAVSAWLSSDPQLAMALNTAVKITSEAADAKGVLTLNSGLQQQLARFTASRRTMWNEEEALIRQALEPTTPPDTAPGSGISVHSLKGK